VGRRGLALLLTGQPLTRAFSASRLDQGLVVRPSAGHLIYRGQLTEAMRYEPAEYQWVLPAVANSESRVPTAAC